MAPAARDVGGPPVGSDGRELGVDPGEAVEERLAHLGVGAEERGGRREQAQQLVARLGAAPPLREQGAQRRLARVGVRVAAEIQCQRGDAPAGASVDGYVARVAARAEGVRAGPVAISRPARACSAPARSGPAARRAWAAWGLAAPRITSASAWASAGAAGCSAVGRCWRRAASMAATRVIGGSCGGWSGGAGLRL